jgi:hypothetical protein
VEEDAVEDGGEDFRRERALGGEPGVDGNGAAGGACRGCA